jgi:hypothetical protein
MWFRTSFSLPKSSRRGVLNEHFSLSQRHENIYTLLIPHLVNSTLTFSPVNGVFFATYSIPSDAREE